MSRDLTPLAAYALTALVAVAVGCEKQQVPVRPDLHNTFVVPPLEVHSVTPREGLAGDVVELVGVGFDPSPAGNRAYIGAARLEVIAATDSTLSARIPTWAATGAIRVTDAFGWRSGVSTDLFRLKAPSSLANGYTGAGAQPSITSNQADVDTIGAGSTTTLVSGGVSDADGDGYWAIVEDDGTVRSMGRLVTDGGTYVQTIPVFCDRQYLLRFFANDSGRAFYRTELLRTDCVEAGIRVQLAWDTDLTDVDLHFIKPGGTYGDSFSDCYFGNSNPDWGVSEDPTDDPELDVDDIDGYGPENIYVSPTEDGAYRVSVHYWSDGGHGPSNAWVEIFVDGQRAGGFGPYRLGSTGARWEVADVAWPSGEVTAIQVD